MGLVKPSKPLKPRRALLVHSPPRPSSCSGRGNSIGSSSGSASRSSSGSGSSSSSSSSSSSRRGVVVVVVVAPVVVEVVVPVLVVVEGAVVVAIVELVELVVLLLVIQAHLGHKIHGDKIQPKVGRHKVRQDKNHKVLEPHRKSTKPSGPARPALLRRADKKKVVLCIFPIRPSAGCFSCKHNANLPKNQGIFCQTPKQVVDWPKRALHQSSDRYI